MYRFIFVNIFFVMMSGCASPGVDRAEQQKLIQEFYASVVDITPVTLSSNVGTGVLVGAGVGILDESDGNSDDMIAGGIAGALIGGLFTAITEGSDEAFEYSLFNAERGNLTLIQKEHLTNATCVKVRIADIATISVVNSAFCTV
ncbi:hypothetical protein Q4489_10455 [Thalassotalea sp. 1_MG-2023]|uniref:hypothetical protein n=1 Tax=Thalassotalea sp. 1_MG-2023 TaxID=3062680 RepID=UPI0026E24A28|nr:hypothetical protein [Thalassotalea sp. 1_MG-2023]MDO6427438.1 hypothetical protein [Thalassotalea sp. 1_MG-2023]